MDISDIDLPNYGILKISLDKKDVDNLYTIIKKYSPSHFQWEGNTLIKSTTDQQQFGLFDDGKLFQTNVLHKVYLSYVEKYGLPFAKTFSTHKHKLTFQRFWCNTTTKGQYQALHNHDSIFSFVVWVNIPFDIDDERSYTGEMHPESGDFIFTYSDITGRQRVKNIHQSKSDSGTMLFFPSTTHHSVYPFYSTDNTRITCSGDLSIGSTLIGDPLIPPLDTDYSDFMTHEKLQYLSRLNSQELIVSDPLFDSLNKDDYDKLFSVMFQSSSYQHT